MRVATKVGVLVCVAAWVACSSEYGDGSRPGERFNACYGNGTCNTGLSCVDGICVFPGETPDAGASSSSGGGSSSSSGGPSIGLTSYYAAVCERLARCTPNLYKTSFSDAADCESFYAAVPSSLNPPTNLPGVVPPTNAEIDACASAIRASACVDLMRIPKACIVHGELPKDAACNIDAQCEGGFCNKGTDPSCGTCASPPLEKKLGEECDSGDWALSAPCGAGMQCTRSSASAAVSTCEPPKARDVVCVGGIDNECEPGFVCGVSKTCVEPSYIEAGDKCASNDTPCPPFTHTCVGMAAVCTRNGRLGDDCGAVPCSAGLACGDDAKCGTPGPLTACK